jgi:predicted nucleotidyltransferase
LWSRWLYTQKLCVSRWHSVQLHWSCTEDTAGADFRLRPVLSPKGDGLRLRYLPYETRRSHKPIQQHEADLKGLGVEHLYMFGSTARGEARNDSDVDLFFDYEKGKLGLFELMDVKAYAARILGRKTDIMTRDSLHKMLRQTIEATAVRVF